MTVEHREKDKTEKSKMLTMPRMPGKEEKNIRISIAQRKQ